MDRRSAPKPQTRLVLVTPPVDEPRRMAPLLADACEAADVAAVILRLAPGGEAELIMRVHALAPSVQGYGAALLLDRRVELALKTGADGAHVSGIVALKIALPILKPDRTIGCAGLTTRHDAMLAAELGTDYVLFGEPDVAGKRPGFDAVRERVAWWAELFEMPCMAYAATLAEAGAFASAGADFVALADTVWNSLEGPGALAEAMQRVRTTAAAP